MDAPLYQLDLENTSDSARNDYPGVYKRRVFGSRSVGSFAASMCVSLGSYRFAGVTCQGASCWPF